MSPSVLPAWLFCLIIVTRACLLGLCGVVGSDRVWRKTGDADASKNQIQNDIEMNNDVGPDLESGATDSLSSESTESRRITYPTQVDVICSDGGSTQGKALLG